MKRELAAIRQSQKVGLPHGTRYATIDLASDGLAYAQAHGARLRAPEMERFVALFFGEDQGHHATLEALEAGSSKSEGLTEGTKVRPWRATRWDYAAQDVGYRLLTLRAQAEGEHGRELDKLVEGCKATHAGGTNACDRGYQQLASDRGRKRSRYRRRKTSSQSATTCRKALATSVEQLD